MKEFLKKNQELKRNCCRIVVIFQKYSMLIKNKNIDVELL